MTRSRALRCRVLFVVGLVAALIPGPGMALAAARAQGHVEVIVRPRPDAASAMVSTIRGLGGRVDARLGIGGMVLASLPIDGLARLTASRSVLSAVPDSVVRLASVDGHGVGNDRGSLTSVAQLIGADRYWAAGMTGKGVDVALIDSGVAPVKGLRTAGKIVNGPDLSFESQDKDLRYLDTFGHGTHMAGIIAGRDPGVGTVSAADRSHFLGIAPGARIVSVKVADAFGTTDVSQVLAAIGWVVKHRHDGDLDIRVLNLAFGTDSVVSYLLDPLSWAVEHAWRKGIFVVVSAGNEGYGSKDMNDPATDPLVMAVGASDGRGTATRSDDVVASFSSVGDASRRPDLVAPGTSILSLRDPGSYIDRAHPAARVGDTPRLFRGSGTSQAAAVVSGAAALVIQQRRGIKPDQLKKLLRSTAWHMPAGTAGQGQGLIDLERAFGTKTPSAVQLSLPSLGTGALNGSRGTLRLVRDEVSLRGDRTIFGTDLDLVELVQRTLAGTAWQGGRWMGDLWSGSCWCADTWSGPAWSGRSWTTDDWSGHSWTSDAWSGHSWTGSGWAGGSWSGRSWTSNTWSGDTWSSAGWGP